MRIQFVATVLATALSVAANLHAADFALKTVEKTAPKEIGESMRAVLQSKAIQLTQGDKPALEIWFRQEVPLKSKPASANEALGTIPETTFMGVVSVVEASLRDYKDNEIPKGIYTARFGLQPKDGDHLGTAEFDYFLILIAAADDKELNGLDKFKPMVKASGKSTASGHPLVVSLRPGSGAGATPVLAEPVDEHKAIRVKLPAKPMGGEKAEITFDVVYQGHGHIQ
jgi:hypothetical protein